MISKTVEGYEYEEFKYCSCKCGFTLPKKNYNYHEQFFIKNHDKKGNTFWRGRKHSEEAKKKIGEAHKGEKNHFYGRFRELNYAWKGDQIKTIEGIHYRMKQIIKKTEKCEICNLVPPFELSNKDHKYREVKEDWDWLCIPCHRERDDNYNKNFKKYNDEKKKGKFR